MNKLTNIARRKHKIDEFINNENKEVKKWKKDKSRIGFKPEKGKSQWSRFCQNSGSVKKQPMILKNNELDKLFKLGYKFNSESQKYEKTFEDKHGVSHTLVAINLKDDNNDDTYYICDNTYNNDYFYIGFLTKSKHPQQLCMPCCYKKNQLFSLNNKIKSFY